MRGVVLLVALAAIASGCEPSSGYVELAIEPSPVTARVGVLRQLVATGTRGDGSTEDLTAEVSWSSSDSDVATVDEAGLLDPQEVGEATIEATLDGLSARAELSVTPGRLVSCSVFPEEVRLGCSDARQLSAIGLFDDGETGDITDDATWESDDGEVVTVDPSGEAEAECSGEAEVVARALLTLCDPAAITVRCEPCETISLSLDDEAAVVVEEPRRMIALCHVGDEATDVTADVRWASSDTSVAEVSSRPGTEGLLSPHAEGVTTVTAILENQCWTAASEALELTVVSLGGVRIEPARADLDVPGETQAFEALCTVGGEEEDCTSAVEWTSSNEAVATISNEPGSEGEALAVDFGYSRVTATRGSDSATAWIVVGAVEPFPMELVVTPDSATIAACNRWSFTATATMSDGSTPDVTEEAWWSTGDGWIATVSNDEGSRGQVDGSHAGETWLGASYGEVSGYAEIEVTGGPVEDVDIDPYDPEDLCAGCRISFSATCTYEGGEEFGCTSSVDWDSSDESVADFVSDGDVRGEAVGRTTISASYGNCFGSTSASATLDVIGCSASSVIVSTPPDPLTAGSTHDLTATALGYCDGADADVTDLAEWGSTNESVASVVAGTVTAVSEGVATISATFGGTSGSVSVHVIF